MNLTENQVKLILPNNREHKEWTILLNKFLPMFDITTERRIAYFIGQCSHESSEFTRLVENLNYSQTGLLTIFPKYFPTINSTIGYTRNPTAIANRVYANRMGNGSEKSGDGWRYRGRGLIQLTGKSNYTRYSMFLQKSLDDTVAYLTTKEGALHSSLWFWTINNLNTFSDKSDIRGQTRRINGGFNGIADRTNKINLALKVL